jgi:type II secretion system protein G
MASVPTSVSFPVPRGRAGFTLIELLIVVAIIGILAAIAIPNYLDAQTRAKVARMRAEMASVRTALEAYYVDHADYPPGPVTPPFDEVRTYLITTPISYISQVPLDVFKGNPDESLPGGPFALAGPYLGYVCDPSLPFLDHYWLLLSYAPDQDGPDQGPSGEQVQYDPSNGTLSNGDIYMVGGVRH